MTIYKIAFNQKNISLNSCTKIKVSFVCSSYSFFSTTLPLFQHCKGSVTVSQIILKKKYFNSHKNLQFHLFCFEIIVTFADLKLKLHGSKNLWQFVLNKTSTASNINLTHPFRIVNKHFYINTHNTLKDFNSYSVRLDKSFLWIN